MSNQGRQGRGGGAGVEGRKSLSCHLSRFDCWTPGMRAELFVPGELLQPRERRESPLWPPSKGVKESVKIRGRRGRVKRV